MPMDKTIERLAKAVFKTMIKELNVSNREADRRVVTGAVIVTLRRLGLARAQVGARTLGWRAERKLMDLAAPTIRKKPYTQI